MYSTPLSWRIFPEKVYSPSRAATSTRMPYMRPRRSARAGRLSFSNYSQPSFHAPYTDASTALTATVPAARSRLTCWLGSSTTSSAPADAA